MFSYIELAEQHVWVDKEVQLFFCYLRFSYSTLYSSVLTFFFFFGVVALPYMMMKVLIRFALL